jgi:hypothetical protein
MRWDKNTIIQDMESKSFSVIQHRRQVVDLLKNWKERGNALDVLVVLLLAADALGKDRVIGWDISEITKMIKDKCGEIELPEEVPFYMSES